MSKITRKTATIFGSTAGSNQIAQFGSLAAGTPQRYSGTGADPANIQSLSNWASGWFAGVEAGNSPAIEDLNGFCFVDSYQLAYILQQGVAEWDSGTTYYKGSIVSSAGALFVSQQDSNLNNALTNSSWWICVLAGTGGALMSASTGIGGNVVITSTSMVDVANLVVSNYVSSGKDVIIECIPTPTNSSVGNASVFQIANTNASTPTAANAVIQLLRSTNNFSTSTVVGCITIGANTGQTSFNAGVGYSVYYAPSICRFIDRGLAAGTYSYKLQAEVSTNNSLFVVEMNLYVHE